MTQRHGSPHSGNSARFGQDWQLSPEQSLLYHTEHATVPQQVITYTPKGTNNRVDLLFGSSLYNLRQHAMPAEADLTSRDELRMFRLESAIVRVPATFFNRYPTEAQVALAGIHDATEILIRLLDQGRSVIVGRLAGAFRRVGREEIADEIKTVMAQAGYDVRETDPFSREHALAQIKQADAPIVGRLRSCGSQRANR
ncbi:MAG: hypothetical protein OXF31_12860 [Gammaproteobacteria bacterium]|nr:hypothetical protein [Gammaproteobacteria bacterium]